MTETHNQPRLANSQIRAGSVGDRLSELLGREEYAELWRPYRKRAHPGPLYQAAIAQAIAEYLWKAGEYQDTDTVLPRRLKDPVSRALRGDSISPRILEWFIGAFHMGEEDAEWLRAALNSDPPSAENPVNSLRSPQELPVPQLHRTVSAFERRVIGPDGVPVEHHTSRAIRAEEDIVRFYPCRQFSAAAEVLMVGGGEITGQRQHPGSSPILEMTLSSPLPVGRVSSLAYQAKFAPGSGVATEYRQVAHARAEHVDIVVQFHQKHLPRSVWWAVWNDHRGGAVLDEQLISLDTGGRAHRHLPSLENAAVGFRWEW